MIRSCFLQDLVIPALRPPQLLESPLIGSPARERRMLAFFRGDFRDEHSPEYSRGLRQKLRRLAREHAWAARYGIYIGDRSEIDGSYESLFTQSIFCLVLPGMPPVWLSIEADSICVSAGSEHDIWMLLYAPPSRFNLQSSVCSTEMCHRGRSHEIDTLF